MEEKEEFIEELENFENVLRSYKHTIEGDQNCETYLSSMETDLTFLKLGIKRMLDEE